MAWGQEKGADFHISALRACQYEIFDFVPCSLPLKTLILLTFSCFLIRRRGKRTLSKVDALTEAEFAELPIYAADEV